MKFRFKKEDKPLYIASAITGLCVLLVVGFAISMTVVYLSGHEITDDRTTNINVMLTRPADWKKIQTGKIFLTPDDFALIDGSTATIPITAELARQFCDASDEDIGDFVDHNTTHNAYINLICTYGDPEHYSQYQSYSPYTPKKLIFATEPSVDELRAEAYEQVTLDVTPVALDGFVFITHKDNPVDSLTIEQVRKIYSGEITNWKDVGGNNQKIIPYQRERNSGSQTAMEQLVMKDVPLMEPAEGYSIWGMGGLVERIAEYENRENSLGYTYYYYINNLYRNENIKVLKINGVSPDNDNLIMGTYPFSTAYYAVIAEGAEDSQSLKMRELRDYLLTDEGQEIIKMAGYCPVEKE